MNPQPTYPQTMYPQPAPDYPASFYSSPITMPVSRSIPVPPAVQQYFAPPAPVSGKNAAALVSLLTSLVVPVTIVTYAFTTLLSTFSTQGDSYNVLSMVGGMIFTLMMGLLFPGSITAIITGHVALHSAKKYSPEAARRWMAIVGTIVGYLGIIALLLSLVSVFAALAMYG